MKWKLIAIEYLSPNAEFTRDYIAEATGDEDIVIDLTKLKDKFLDEKLVVNGNLFEYELPMTKVKVQFKFITSAEENSVQKEDIGCLNPSKTGTYKTKKDEKKVKKPLTITEK